MIFQREASGCTKGSEAARAWLRVSDVPLGLIPLNIINNLTLPDEDAVLGSQLTVASFSMSHGRWQLHLFSLGLSDSLPQESRDSLVSFYWSCDASSGAMRWTLLHTLRTRRHQTHREAEKTVGEEMMKEQR